MNYVCIGCNSLHFVFQGARTGESKTAVARGTRSCEDGHQRGQQPNARSPAAGTVLHLMLLLVCACGICAFKTQPELDSALGETKMPSNVSADHRWTEIYSLIKRCRKMCVGGKCGFEPV